jgi:hypothetical protein
MVGYKSAMRILGINRFHKNLGYLLTCSVNTQVGGAT